jgi:hypothetical protein
LRILPLSLAVLYPLTFCLGCAANQAWRRAMTIPMAELAAPPAEVQDEKDFCWRVINTLPAWKRDGLYRFEIAEIATVEADIKKMQAEDEEAGFMADAKKLHEDWESLVALDTRLQNLIFS